MTLVVFTDLDGTLLDHETYSWEAARPALNDLKSLAIPLVLASSKTAAEIAALHEELSLGETPAIVENGAGFYWPGEASLAPDDDYRTIRAALDDLPPALRRNYAGFGDMSDEQVRDVTGLPLAAARSARKRQFTEPGTWNGTQEELAAFLKALDDRKIAARYGGRFLTLGLGRTKAMAMAEIADRLGATVTIALGDAPNDREMLEAASYGILVRNENGTPIPTMDGEENGRIRRTSQTGPEGWNTALRQLLAELGLERELKTHG